MTFPSKIHRHEKEEVYDSVIEILLQVADGTSDLKYLRVKTPLSYNGIELARDHILEITETTKRKLKVKIHPEKIDVTLPCYVEGKFAKVIEPITENLSGNIDEIHDLSSPEPTDGDGVMAVSDNKTATDLEFTSHINIENTENYDSTLIPESVNSLDNDIKEPGCSGSDNTIPESLCAEKNIEQCNEVEDGFNSEGNYKDRIKQMKDSFTTDNLQNQDVGKTRLANDITRLPNQIQDDPLTSITKNYRKENDILEKLTDWPINMKTDSILNSLSSKELSGSKSDESNINDDNRYLAFPRLNRDSNGYVDLRNLSECSDCNNNAASADRIYEEIDDNVSVLPTENTTVQRNTDVYRSRRNRSSGATDVIHKAEQLQEETSASPVLTKYSWPNSSEQAQAKENEIIGASVNTINNTVLKSYKWTELGNFFHTLGFDKHISTLHLKKITGEKLLTLTEKMLTSELGLNIVESRVLFNFLHQDWRPKFDSDESESQSKIPSEYTVSEVYQHLVSNEYKELANYLRPYRVDGELLREIVMDKLLLEITFSDGRKLETFENEDLKARYFRKRTKCLNEAKNRFVLYEAID